MRPFASCTTVVLATLTVGCRDVIDPLPRSLAPDSASVAVSANKKPSSSLGSLSLRTTGNTSWSVSLAWDARSGTASYRVRRLIREVGRDLVATPCSNRAGQPERIDGDPTADHGRAIAPSPQEARGRHRYRTGASEGRARSGVAAFAAAWAAARAASPAAVTR